MQSMSSKLLTFIFTYFHTYLVQDPIVGYAPIAKINHFYNLH